MDLALVAGAEGDREQRQCGGFAEVPGMRTAGQGGARESESGSRIHRLLCGGSLLWRRARYAPSKVSDVGGVSQL